MSQILRKMLLGYMQATPDGTTPPAPAAPVPATPGTPDDTPEEIVNWDALSSETPGEDDGEPPLAPDGQPPAPATPATPAPAAPATPAAPPSPAPVPPAAVPPVVPGTPPVTPPAPVPPPTPATPPPAQPTQEEQAAQAKAFRDNAVANLSKQYEEEMTVEEKQQLLTDPEKVVSRLMAKAAFDGIQIAQRLAHESIMRELPAVQQHQQAVRQAEEAFFTSNPDLNKPEYVQVVVHMAQTARALNPKGTPEQVAASAANLARAQLGLPAPGAPAAAAVPPATPARPFSPAGGGGASPGRPPASGKDPNSWEELAKDED